MKALIMSGTERPQLAAAGWTIHRSTWCACALWVHVGTHDSSVRATIGLAVCSGRRFAAACEGGSWVVYRPREDWAPPAWQSPGECEFRNTLPWADESNVDDPWAPAHVAARAALGLLASKSWPQWWTMKLGDGAAAAADGASRLDAALRDHHGRAVAKGDTIVMTVGDKEIFSTGGRPKEHDFARVREILRERLRRRCDTR
jgi:hypothetical protein